MRMKKQLFRLLAISLILLSACGTVRVESKETDFTPLQNIVILTSSLPPPALSPSITATRVTETVTPTSPLPTDIPFTPTPTRTSTPYPTLITEDQGKYHLSLLAKSDCVLPCFWGIVPGSTTEIQMWDIFLPVFGSPTNSEITFWNPDEIVFDIFTATTENTLLPPNATMTITLDSQGIVKAMEFDPLSLHAPSDDLFYDPALDHAILRYSLSQVLSNLGPPSRVYIDLQAGMIEKGAPWIYEIWLIYDTPGVAILYTYQNIGISINDDRLHVCPQDRGLIDLDIFVQSADMEKLVTDLLDLRSTAYSGRQKDIHTLEDATGLTLDDFYDLFNQTGSLRCFQSPADIWY